MTPKVFYRVGTVTGHQGLWYDRDGNFTGLIHSKYQHLKSSKLEMPFDPNVVGFLSATQTLEELHEWFSEWCIEQLRPFGFVVLEYVATDYKSVGSHWLINQRTSILNRVF